ncbi:MAG: pilus (MSHA type) biogenesis protein MshL [Magnetococcales bacterium]|nr:pilus (MSHA type) biogenesis protein MshL [Magnetococcales bacterium]
MNMIKTIALTVSAVFLLSGCAGNPQKEEDASKYDEWTAKTKFRLPHADADMARNSDNMFEEIDQMRERFERKQPQPVRVAPLRPQPDPMDLTMVTLDVTNGEVQHVLRALATQAGLDLVMHPSVAGVSNRISVHFNSAPASRVLNHILRIADLHGETEGRLLSIMPLQEKIFHLDFLETSFKTSMAAGGDVLGSSQVDGGSSGLTGSFEISGEIQPKNNPYDQLEEMLKTLVGTVQDPNALGGETKASQSVSEVGAVSQINNAIRQDTPTYHLNRLTGTLFVRAKRSVISNVSALIHTFKKTLSQQVVMEAQIIEVQLSDGHQHGVNWSILNDRLVAGMAANGLSMGSISTTLRAASAASRSISVPAVSFSDGKNMFSFGFGDGTFNAALNLLKYFGEVRVLSNPFIRTQHGRPAFISVGTTNSYVSKSPSQILSSTTGTSVGSDEQPQVSTVFDGLVVGVVPFIDEDKMVSMTIHPIQSTVDSTSLTLVDVGNNFKLTLPKVDLKEMTTTLKVHDGDTVMLGGLISRTQTTASERVPILGDIPILGKAFRKDSEAETGRELVIILRVNVI